MRKFSELKMTGRLRAKKIRGDGINLFKIFKTIRRKIKEMMRGKGKAIEITGRLSAKHTKRSDGEVVVDLGLVSVDSVTTAGCEYLVDSFQNSTGSPMSDFYWHRSGTSTGVEAIGDTALGAEVGEASSGSQTETSSVIYKSVGTQTYTTGSSAITEHGLFSSSGGATLWDRSLFAAINVSSGDSVEFTYELTVTAGG